MLLGPDGPQLGRGDPYAFRVQDTTGQEWPLLVPVVATFSHVRACVMDALRALLGDETRILR